MAVAAEQAARCGWLRLWGQNLWDASSEGRGLASEVSTPSQLGQPLGEAEFVAQKEADWPGGRREDLLCADACPWGVMLSGLLGTHLG